MRVFIALGLTMTIFLSSALMPISAKQVNAASKAEQVIDALGIMNTDQESNKESTEIVTRSQFAQMIVNLSIYKGKVAGKSNVALFRDVPRDHWASGYILTAVSQGWMTGYLDGTFRPDKGITLQEAASAAIKLLGYTKNDFSGNVIGGQMTLFKSKKLNKSIGISEKAYMRVEDCSNLFYNTLNATTRDGKVYAEAIGYVLNANGELDYLSFIDSDMEGPIIAHDRWKNEIPFSVTSATIYKDGVKTSYGAISDYDVLYYSENIKTIWAYDNKVTGTVQSINPDYISPKSVTLAGKEYTLGSSDARSEFSSMGDVQKGDLVTLLLGKNDTVAGVLSINEFNVTITGVVLETGKHVIEKKNDDIYHGGYVNYVDAAGNVNQQDYDEKAVTFEKGNLIHVEYKDGIAKVSKYPAGSNAFNNSVFSEDGSKLGRTNLASNVKILDYKDGQYTSVYPERLAGVSIGSSSIYYYNTNANNEISELILNDVTGDLDKFGIFTGFNDSGFKSLYEYIIDGKKGSTTLDTYDNISLDQGPVGFEYKDNTIIGTYKLTGVTVKSIGSATIQDGSVIYPLSDRCSVYVKMDDDYVLTTLDKVSDLSKYYLQAYYDKAPVLGGRIRVITAVIK